MSYRLPRYQVTLIREGSCAVEQKAIRSPEDIFAIMATEYENAVVEAAMMLALDTKNKVMKMCAFCAF
jgi:DNA repair protein RadC